MNKEQEEAQRELEKVQKELSKLRERAVELEFIYIYGNNRMEENYIAHWLGQCICRFGVKGKTMYWNERGSEICLFRQKYYDNNESFEWFVSFKYWDFLKKYGMTKTEIKETYLKMLREFFGMHNIYVHLEPDYRDDDPC